jgi:hypothetical protein
MITVELVCWITRIKLLPFSSTLGILLFLCFVHPKQFVDLIFCRTTIERKFEEETDTNEEMKEEPNLADKEEINLIEENNLSDTQEIQDVEIAVEELEHREVEIEMEELDELKNEIQELKEREVETKEIFDKLQIELRELREKQEEKERKKIHEWYIKPILKSSERRTKVQRRVTSSETSPSTSDVKKKFK